ncbi:MAG TPA: prolipoprotein diacylglyceryl transferase [Cyclobacteriaceae bacterium]|nr:prolipoprotein diacylglyceryl transferase [Cyclobacteriaceae bacterium]
MPIHFIHWNLNPEIDSFGFPLRYYGMFFAGGILACVVLLKYIFKREHIPQHKLDTLTIYGFVGIFLGARLGHCLLYDPGYYFQYPLEIWLPIKAAADGYEYIGYQGLASHGGIAGLILALVTYARRTGESVLNTVDLISIVAPLGGCFIRLGNLMNSEILGFPTSVPWAFVFEREDQLPRHPAQLYEAILYLLIFLFMYYLYVSFRPRLKNGFFFGTGMALVFTSRFLIEFLKERQVAFESQMVLDMGQWLSVPFVLVGIGFVVYGLKTTRQITDRAVEVVNNGDDEVNDSRG